MMFGVKTKDIIKSRGSEWGEDDFRRQLANS